MKQCDTMRHNATGYDNQIGIQNGNTRVFRPAINRFGKKVPGVYVRDGYYYIRTTDVDGKRHWVKAIEQSLEGATRFLAQFKRERDQNRMQRFSDALEGVRARRTVASMAQVFEAYEKAAAEKRALEGFPCKYYVRAVISNVQNIIEEMSRSPESTVADVLPDIVREWVKEQLQSGELSRYTIKKCVASCKSLFSSWARDYYGRIGLKVPVKLDFVSVKTPVAQYSLPVQDVRDKVVEYIKMQWQEHTPISFVLVLAYFAGMSRADIVRAEWSWVRDGHVYYSRHKTGRRADPPLPEFVADWFGSSDALTLSAERQFIVPGDTEDARYRVCEQAGRELRSIGWGDRLVLHELRKLACSQWATRCGLQWAARWIGDSEATAASYYRDLLPEEAPKAW